MITRLPHQSFALVLLLLLVVSTTADAQQNPHELFQQARMFDESNQNLTEAIALYRQVATLSTDQRKLAAEAQLSVGLLYERLGQTAQAQQAYAAVLDEYADQTEVARQAQVRMLASREQAQEASDIVIRRVWAGRQLDRVGSPSPDGRYLTFIDWGQGGKVTWPSMTSPPATTADSPVQNSPLLGGNSLPTVNTLPTPRSTGICSSTCA